jgi:hypothetical protein
MLMPLPAKTVSLSLPGNLWGSLRREARRVDRSADSLLLEHVVRWLQALPDRDAAPAAALHGEPIEAST